ncbi:MAG: DMT family transporter [Pseudomonadota bacterium]
MKTKNNTIMVILAYLIMIIIWSTTPLAIKWSSSGVDFITALSARMLIGTTIAVALSLLFHKSIPLHKKALQVYFASSFSIYGAMMLVYYGAQFISSGLVSVIFGTTTMFTSWFAIQFFASEKFCITKLLGALFGIAGLSYIYIEQMHMGEQALIGILSILAAVIIHSMSAVWIKHIDIKLPALSITAGSLSISLPVFLLTFWLFAQPLPNEIPTRTLWSIIYLGIMGSVVGFSSYYYALANLKASTVALTTLITPITALLLGNIFNNELITSHIWLGTTLIITGLFIYQLKQSFAFPLLKRSKESI